MQRRTALDPTIKPFGASVRSLPRVLTLTVILALVLGTTAAARADDASDAGVVDVIQVSGYIDPVVAHFIDGSITEAETAHADALVIQLDSPGSVVSDTELQHLVGRIHTSVATTVAVWVGPSGAQAAGDSAQLVLAAKVSGLAPGSTLEVNGQHLSAKEAYDQGKVTIPADCAREQGSTEGCAATIGDFIVSIPGVPTKTITEGDQTRVEPAGQTRFAQLSLIDRLMHTVASPPTAYLLFAIGMALLVFELFTAGVGVAGVVGAAFFLLGCYGLAVLPTRPWAAALLVFAMFGYSIDVQTGVPRIWTGVATVSFTIGSIALY